MRHLLRFFGVSPSDGSSSLLTSATEAASNASFRGRRSLIWTKISYTVYLTQFPVFFYNVGVARTAEHYGFFKILFNLKELLWIGVLSVVLTLTSRDALPEYSQYNIQEERNRTRTAPSEDQLIINCRFYLFNN
jgi:hypothetical protein